MRIAVPPKITKAMSSSIGVGFEAVSAGPPESRRCCPVPIAVPHRASASRPAIARWHRGRGDGMAVHGRVHRYRSRSCSRRAGRRSVVHQVGRPAEAGRSPRERRPVRALAADPGAYGGNRCRPPGARTARRWPPAEVNGARLSRVPEEEPTERSFRASPPIGQVRRTVSQDGPARQPEGPTATGETGPASARRRDPTRARGGTGPAIGNDAIRRKRPASRHHWIGHPERTGERSPGYAGR